MLSFIFFPILIPSFYRIKHFFIFLNLALTGFSWKWQHAKISVNTIYSIIIPIKVNTRIQIITFFLEIHYIAIVQK